MPISGPAVPAANKDMMSKIWTNGDKRGKFLGFIKLKAFVDDKLNTANMNISGLDRVESAMEKGENAGYQHFLLFPQCFPKDLFFRFMKSQDCVLKS